jgi:hypothetical protein
MVKGKAFFHEMGRPSYWITLQDPDGEASSTGMHWGRGSVAPVFG